LSELKNQAEIADRPHSKSMRLFSTFEIKKMDSECRGFLVFLENLGVLNPFTREVVIDRVMALETADISVDQLKWVVMMVLFNQPGEEAALAWIEDLVFREDVGLLH
jgi:Smg protein